MMTLAIILAVIFALAAGVFLTLARRAEGKPALYYWVGFAVGLLQALALGIAAMYPEIGTPGYVATLLVVGGILLGAVVWLSQKAAQRQR